jgi:hypothetical protein
LISYRFTSEVLIVKRWALIFLARLRMRTNALVALFAKHLLTSVQIQILEADVVD